MGGRRSLRWRSCGLPNPALNRTAQPRCCGVPSALRGGELELHLVHVLNVSHLGARFIHLATSEEAEGLAKAYLGVSDPAN